MNNAMDTLATPDTMIRMLIQLLCAFVMLRLIYFNKSSNRDALFGFMVFGYGVFLISRLLSKVEISLGFAFGLFAVLSMLRYRTEALSVRDMTYLFMVIVVALLCAVAPISLVELFTINVFICLLMFFLESSFFAAEIVSRKLHYDSLANITEDQYPVLLAEVKQRTGLDIIRIEVQEIDYLRDSARLQVFYQNRI